MKHRVTTMTFRIAAALLLAAAAAAGSGPPPDRREPGPGVVTAAGRMPDMISGHRVEGADPPSPFGRPTSRRWAYGASYARESLRPVANPDPAPEPQPVRDHPFDVEVSGDGTRVYIGLLGAEILPRSEVAVYDVARDRVVKRILLRPAGVEGPAGLGPYRLTMHPGGRYLVVTNRFSNFASVIDTTTDEVVSEIPLDFYCQGMAFDPRGNVGYVANRYLDQVFVVDFRAGGGGAFAGEMRVLGGIDDAAFLGQGEKDPGIAGVLRRSCGTAGCHAERTGGFVAGADARESFLSVLSHVMPGDSRGSRLLRAAVRTRDGGYADRIPKFQSHASGTVVFKDPVHDPAYQAIARWIDSGGDGPGIPVGNRRSKPKVCALTPDGRHLFVGNTGTQDISIVDTRLQAEVGAIYVQNVVNDLAVYHSPKTGRSYLIVTTEGIGFGVGKERDPFGGETWDRDNPAAQFSVWRDLETGATLPRERQRVLGPFDAVDGTASIKFRDIQNDLVFIDVDSLAIPETVPEGGLEHILKVNRYESHRRWVRYTSDTAESTWGDIKGDIPPDLMRVVGAFPEKIAVAGDRLYVTMQGSEQVQEWRIQPEAPDPSDSLMPLATYPTGIQPIGIAAGRPGTPSAGKVFVANFLGGSLSVIDPGAGTSREVIVDPSIEPLPVPATNAERGEIFVHTSVFSSDGDTSCFHCHYLDMGDGRPWGVSQMVGQEYLSPDDEEGQLVIGGTMQVPQMRGLFGIQPFFLEGVISVFEPRSMMMEHCPDDDFLRATPQGDFTGIEAHYVLAGTKDIQSSMASGARFQASLEERRDEFFRRQSMRLFGKAFRLRDVQRFVGEWQLHEPRLLPNPYDARSESVLRGKELYEHPEVGCVSCHPPPNFTKKDFPNNPTQSLPPLVTTTARDGSFTLISMNRLDAINGVRRDLEPWDEGRAEDRQAHFTTLQLRGIWDRPPVFLHNGMARTLREVVASPGNPSLGRFRYEPLVGGEPERPGRKEVGFNGTYLFHAPSPKVRMHMEAGARLGFDTHGGTSQLTPQQIDDLVNFLLSIE